MTKLTEIETFWSPQRLPNTQRQPYEDIQWLIARVKRLEDALKQCKVYSECYDELIMTINEALIE